MRWLAVAVLCLFAANASADWGAKRDPFDVGTVNRYKAILAKNPHDEGALRQLVSLYKRFRTVAKLEEEFLAKLETAADDWAVHVVLARLPRDNKQLTLDYWQRSTALRPQDVRTWIGFGDALRTTTPSTAKGAYHMAANVATDPKEQKLALTKLIGVALPAVDGKLLDEAYGKLIALSPKNGALWLDRGNAQLAAKQYGDARSSFVEAEALLKSGIL